MISRFTRRVVRILMQVVMQNLHLDFLTLDFAKSENCNAVRLHGISIDRGTIIEQLKAYQRIKRITEGLDGDVEWSLLERNITSATQIAGMTKGGFVNAVSDCRGMSKETAEMVYRRALAKRSEILPQYMNLIQNNEPHIKQAAI